MFVDLKEGDRVTAFEWNLIYMVEWLSENVKYILRDEPFPLPVKGQHSLELLKHCLLFESDDDDECDAWFDAKQEGEFKHSWFSNRAGFFCRMYFLEELAVTSR
jgi:hypothetical protein